MSCADVCLSHDYDGYNEFFSEKEVKAKKTHDCSECSEPIRPGDAYVRMSGKSYGDFWTAATCATCAEIRRAFVCGSFEIGMLWESIREEMFPVWREKGAWDCLAKLTRAESVEACNRQYQQWLLAGAA